MFSFRENQTSYWKNTDTVVDPVSGTIREPSKRKQDSQTIPYKQLSKKAFQKTSLGSSRLEEIRADIFNQSAAPLRNNEGWQKEHERRADLYEQQFRTSQETLKANSTVDFGRQAALDYTINRSTEKTVTQLKQEKKQLVEEFRKPHPVKLSATLTSNQLFYGKSTANLHHYWREKKNESLKRTSYEGTLYHPEQKSKSCVYYQ